ncbi:MAG: cation diffusion facilitator family transporter [Lactobacillus sp.]|nr:cation diffusion facilitator family transporter [Lactobacillus sp.]MDN6042788.1 cation diffusion facilitator family transporter [Lactobacillus sp.]MDN6052864.1 cation diffusion facilitator family transporter [Lactobacillus sp.]
MLKRSENSQYLLVTVLNVLVTVIEFVGGFASGSLALLSDAFHNLGDVGAISLSLVAHLISRRKRNGNKTFGYERAETLAAFTNSILLIAISLGLLVEAGKRLLAPEPVHGQTMLVLALVGLITNFLSMAIMLKGQGANLNRRATFLHMLGDALASIVVVLGGLVLSHFPIWWLDPVLTLLLSVFMIMEAARIIYRAIDVLMESNPDVDLATVHRLILSFPQVKNVHHVHLWRYSDRVIMLDAHINVVDAQMPVAVLERLYSQIGDCLKRELGINHVTLQAEYNRGKNEQMIVPQGTEE